MDGHDLAEVVGALGIFTLLTTVITVTIWQLAANWRAKVTLARESEYQDLAARAVASQERSSQQLAGVVEQLTEVSEQLTDLRTRMAQLERVLTEVE
jgi:phage shock protein A